MGIIRSRIDRFHLSMSACMHSFIHTDAAFVRLVCHDSLDHSRGGVVYWYQNTVGQVCLRASGPVSDQSSAPETLDAFGGTTYYRYCNQI